MSKTILLNQNWIFSKEGHDEPVTLPHTWNAIDGQDGGNDYWRGTCIYRTHFAAPQFNTASHQVWIQFVGTPFGTFVPTMKISTSSTLAKNKPGWIHFNAGVIVENEPMEKTCERFIDYIIRVASGEPVNNEKKNYREIAIFKTGVTL